MKRIFTFLAFLCLTFSVFAAAPPTVPGSGLTFPDIDGSRLSLRFTAGNGLYRIVVMKEGSPVVGTPVNGQDYTANTNFGTPGTEFTMPGEYVIATKSSWNSFSATNLKPGTVYHIAVFEYNGTGATAEYLMLPLTGNQSTARPPTAQASFTSVVKTGNSITINIAKGNGSGRIILARKDGPVNAVPADLANYYTDENFGSGAKLNTDNYVVYRGAGTAVTVKGLEPNTSYHFAVFEYNGSSSPVFLTPGGTTAITTNAGPSIASSAISLNYVEGNGFRLGCTQGNGARRLFIMSKNGPITAVPVNGQVYNANRAFGTAGTEIAAGEYVVGAVTGNSVDVTNLEANTLYYFRIYDYDVDLAGNTYYLASSSAIKTGSTALIPTTIGSNLTLTKITGSSASVGLTHGNGTMRMVIVREGAPVNAAPADYTTYTGNANFGSGAQIAPGNFVTQGAINGNPFTINNLKPGFTYHIAVYEFNGSSAPVYSRTAATFSFSVPVEPTSCSTAPWATFFEGSSFRFIWTSGNGARRIVVARKESPVSVVPTDGTIYTASANFGEGDALSDGQFVVFDGTYNSVDIENMEIGSTYHFAVFEYNVGENGSPDYLTSCSLTGTAATVSKPTTQTIIQGVSNVQAGQVTINFTKGNGSGRLFIMREDAAVSVTPQDLIKYTQNSGFGGAGSHISDGNYVVLNSSGSGSFNVTNLKPQTTYHVAAFEYNGSSKPAYLRDMSSVFNFTTTDIPGATVPTVPSMNPVFQGIDGNKYTFKWTSGNGEKRIVVMKKSAAPSFVPSAATNYTANAAFGNGPDLGDGEYIVYNGNGNTVDITNLEPAANYHLVVFEYNGTGSLTRYLTSSVLAGNASTALAPSVVSNNMVTTVTGNSVLLSWEKGNGTGRIVVMRQGSAVNSTPADLSVYPANAMFGAGSQVAAGDYVVYAGTGSSVTVTGLTESVYHFSLFEYNGSGAPVYNNTNTSSGSVTIGSTLPVSLLFFTAEEKDETVLLKWATSQELDNAYFDVERSTDGNIFRSISKIPGAGNSNTRLEYNYVDALDHDATKIYYRLKQVDIDGKYNYSGTVTVKPVRSQNRLLVYPNPVQDQFTIKLPAGTTAAVFTIYNTTGNLVLSGKLTATQQLNIAHLPAGSYYLLVQDGKNKYQMQVIKN